MPRRPIFTDVMKVLERRIAEGDYMLKDLPSERRLAEEVGVSYMTARKAVLGLIEKKVLLREPGGALAVHPRLRDAEMSTQVALLTPAYPSAHFVHCRVAISRAADRHGVAFRPVEYVHWYDPIVKEALDGSDGLIVIPSTEPIPERRLKEFAERDRKVVFFDGDLTGHGMPSIQLYPDAHLDRLMEHLGSLGRGRIDCLNAQGQNQEIERRIDHWRGWRKAHDVRGELWDTPVRPYGDPIVQAHQTMTDLLKNGEVEPATLLCTTQPAAMGAIRACFDAGLKVGQDVAVGTVNNEPTGRYFCPSLTGLELPDIEPLVERCFAWFASEGPGWAGELHVTPDRPHLFIGESTTGRGKRA
ncbi:MAG: substrate-binding domain-containing protein [Planctomycetota bacterium]